ncbi:MAG: hypothetical protein R2932_33770 [Caldilineaceae bacterium]
MGASIDGQGGWSLNLGFVKFGITPSTQDPTEIDTSFNSGGSDGTLTLQKPTIIDFNNWQLNGGPDRHVTFGLDTSLDMGNNEIYSLHGNPEVHLSGQIDWRIGQPWDFTPSQIAKTNHIDEKLYAVMLSEPQ